MEANKDFFNTLASLGRCRSKTGWVYGFKVALVVDLQGVVTAFGLALANCDECPIGDAFIVLYPLRHRGEDSQAHLALIRSREALVGSHTQLINYVRGAVKFFGNRLPRCSARSFHKKVAEDLPRELMLALGPLPETIGELTARIWEYVWGYDRRCGGICCSLHAHIGTRTSLLCAPSTEQKEQGR